MDETPPPKPTLRVYYVDTVQAEAFARSLGVEADYGNRLDIADYCNELLTQLSERNLLLPERIQIDARTFRDMGGPAMLSPASAKAGRIAVNPASPYWTNPVAFASAQFAQRFWSTGHPLHPLYHEAGHVLLYRTDAERYASLRDLRDAQKTMVVGEVSKRACYNGHEFVSEVFAGLMTGRRYSADIMRWYRSRGGIRP